MSERSIKSGRISRFKGTMILSGIYEHLLVSDTVDAFPGTVFVGGSYCRQQPMIGDLDVAILIPSPEEDKELNLLALHRINTIPGRVLKGSGVYIKRLALDIPRLVQYDEHLPLEFQLDIWITHDPNTWGPLCMFVAGSGDLNIKQRCIAGSRGYTLSQYGLYKGDKLIPCRTEQEVYEKLNICWLPYEQRNLSFEV